MSKHLLIAAVTLVLPLTSIGGPDQFECNVVAEKELGSAGILVAPKPILYEGETFYVDRKVGSVLGGNLGNASYPRKLVLDPGNADMSDKLMWISKEIFGLPGSFNVVYLVIQEYTSGVQKPFVLVAGDRVLTGICT